MNTNSYPIFLLDLFSYGSSNTPRYNIFGNKIQLTTQKMDKSKTKGSVNRLIEKNRMSHPIDCVIIFDGLTVYLYV